MTSEVLPSAAPEQPSVLVRHLELNDTFPACLALNHQLTDLSAKELNIFPAS